MSVWAIALAAGTGARFGGPKQFALLAGRPLVDHVVETAAAVCDAVVVVIPPGWTWQGPAVTAVVAGGPTRAASVRSGLAAVADSARIVVIHDAAHPLAPAHLFQAVVDRVRAGAEAAVPVLPVAETVGRQEGDEVVTALDDRRLVLMQTPHAFRADVLRAAHRGAPDARDDASLILALGGRVAAVPGDPRNLHVTTAAELAMAAAMLGEAR